MREQVKAEAEHIYKIIGAQIRRLRVLHGLSQQKLGDLLGVTFQQVQKYERGTNQINVHTLVLLSQHFVVPITYFFEEASPVEAAREDETGLRMRMLLLRYFTQIPSASVRKSVFAFVKTLVDKS